VDVDELRWKVVELVDAGDLASVKELVAANAEIIELEPWVYRAAQAGHVDLVEFFLDAGLDVNQRGEYSAKRNALCAAAGSKNATLVRFLLRRGAVAELESPERDPLFSAVYCRSLDCARALVESGIDIHKTYDLGDGRLKNALLYAEQMGCTDIADYLRMRGATLPGTRKRESAHRQGDCAILGNLA
jgi:ankyrin repeat protein